MKKFIHLCLLIPCFTLAGETSDATKAEIEHLFDYLKLSGCQFNRNGSWHQPEDAAEHLQNKFQYMSKRGLVSSAEDFINRAASKSSITGRAYKVKCADSEAQNSEQWLKQELSIYRQSKA